MEIKRIHITGASGSGTTTLGRSLSAYLGYQHIDSDDYFWLPTDPPFQTVRPLEERKKLLDNALSRENSWVSSGSLCGWGDFAIPRFDLVIFLYLPQKERIKRLIKREQERSPESFIEGSVRFRQFNEFIEWAKKYDTGGLEVRSQKLHTDWLQKLSVPVMKIEGTLSKRDTLNLVLLYLFKKKGG